jgi:hypothetical protein
VAIHAHVCLLGGTEGVVHPVAPRAIEADPVWRISRQEPRLGAVEEVGYIVGLGRVSALKPMVAELPEVAGLRAGCPSRLLERIVEVEALHVLALLTDLQLAEQVPDLVLAEARERQVDVGRRLRSAIRRARS